MNKRIPYHFLILAIGEILKRKSEISYVDLLYFLNNDESLKIFKPATPSDCKISLKMACDCGFIKRKDELYYVKNCGH